MSDRFRYVRYWLWLRVMDALWAARLRGWPWDFALCRAAACLRRKDWTDG